MEIDVFDQYITDTFDNLHQSNIQYTDVVFDLITRWLIGFSSHLSSWFGDHFAEEKTAEDNYIPMSRPDHYPAKAKFLLNAEIEKNAVVAAVKNELSDVRSYASFSQNSAVLKNLIEMYDEFDALYTCDEYKLVITIYHGILFDESNKDLLSDVKSKFPKKPCYALNFIEEANGLAIKFSKIISNNTLEVKNINVINEEVFQLSSENLQNTIFDKFDLLVNNVHTDHKRKTEESNEEKHSSKVIKMTKEDVITHNPPQNKERSRSSSHLQSTGINAFFQTSKRARQSTNSSITANLEDSDDQDMTSNNLTL